MKQAILLHGTGGSSEDYFWFENTKEYLEQNGYEVWWPYLPNTKRPELQESLAFLQKNMPAINEETIIVGHSSACPLILTLLQDIAIQVKQVVLVAGFYEPISSSEMSKIMLPKDGWDIEKIKAHVAEIILINSDNDPWGCDDKQAKPMAEKLGAEFVLMKDQGHMGSLTFGQAYREFPELKKLLKV